LRLECRFVGETLWLSLNQMTELFGRDKSGIAKHLKAIFEEGELAREATVAKYATVQTEGKPKMSHTLINWQKTDAVHKFTTSYGMYDCW